MYYVHRKTIKNAYVHRQITEKYYQKDMTAQGLRPGESTTKIIFHRFTRKRRRKEDNKDIILRVQTYSSL